MSDTNKTHGPKLDEATGVHTVGHEWDGIEELNNPLPRWWLWTLYLCIAWGVVYTVLYPAWPMINSAPAAPVTATETTAGTRPAALEVARDGMADDLKRIAGIGPKLETVLNDLGIYHFDQIAAWTPAEVAWVDGYLRFKGRIDRDGWVDQAGRLARQAA